MNLFEERRGNLSAQKNNNIYKIEQYSFIVECMFLAFLSIILIRRLDPPTILEWQFFASIVIIIIAVIIYMGSLYKFKYSNVPSKLELFLRVVFVLISGWLLAQTNDSSVRVIIVLPTVLVALRYAVKYTILIAGVTSLVVIVSDTINQKNNIDYEFIFICFIWLLGILISKTMENERQLYREKQKLLENEKYAAMGQMAAGIVHEVKNPLTTIKGFIQLLERNITKKDPKEVKDYLKVINKEIDRVNNLLKDFLQYAKPSTPKFTICNFNQILLDMSILLESQCTAKGIKLEIDLEAVPPEGYCDTNQITQVILNICLNAIDSMVHSPQKILTINTFTDAEYIYVVIKDTGCGMTKEQMEKIFNPFYTTKEHGTGLGLSVCYKIVENHSGKISVESEVNQGTRVSIVLPKNLCLN